MASRKPVTANPFQDGTPLPPYSLEAEQSVIGGLLLAGTAQSTLPFDVVADIIEPSDFYRSEHRVIFGKIADLADQAKPVDVVTVYESLQSEGKADDVGGLAYLGELANAVPGTANIKRYAEIVRDHSTMRKLLAMAVDIQAMIQSPGASRDAATVIGFAEQQLGTIADKTLRRGGGLRRVNESISAVIDTIQERYDGNGSVLCGVPTGLTGLDELTSGLQPTDMIILAGRPAMGKTSLALNIAEHVALESNLPVAIFSMEMPISQLTMRFLSSTGRIELQRMRSGALSEDDFGRLSYAIGRLSEAPIFIDETPSLTPTELRSRARKLKREHGKLGLIVIDYLQLMTLPEGGNKENRAGELSEISRAVKSLAKELGVPIIALSQLNRGLEQRPNKRPVMSDLRESGAIEQDADVIAFIYRDEVYNPDSNDRGTAEIILGKHRNGPIGMTRATFSGQYTRFDNFITGGS